MVADIHYQQLLLQNLACHVYKLECCIKYYYYDVSISWIFKLLYCIVLYCTILYYIVLSPVGEAQDVVRF